MIIKTRWAELFPDEFLERQQQQPLVYLPMGICEPHGHISTFGLDTFKADYLCDEAARRFGGIVAPTQGYQIHEAGYHAPWLAEVLGERPGLMTGMPPHVMLHFFLYQLRAFFNAGFEAAVVITGHSGGNQNDFRLAAQLFEQYTGMKVLVYADPELVAGLYEGDHAGVYEISQSLYLRPETVNLAAIDRMNEPGSLGRFAQGHDAREATAEKGKDIIEQCLHFLGRIISELPRSRKEPSRQMMHYNETEKLYQQLRERNIEWSTLKIREGQMPSPHSSIWKPYERTDIY